MNKKLVALGVASAFALPLAAQAQTANVTLYGRANVDLEWVNGETCASPAAQGNSGVVAGAVPGNNIVTSCTQGGPDSNRNITNPHVLRLSSNSSRFGMRGTESLGGGLNAIFQVESNVSWDTGNSSSSGIASRETFVGLQGSWGRATVGKFLMPMDDLHPIFGNAPTLTTSILSTGALWAQAYLGPALAGGFDGRLPNSVRYDSPTIRGLNASVQYSTAEGSPTTSSGIISVGAFYNNGPVQLGAAYELHHNIRGSIDAPSCTGPLL